MIFTLGSGGGKGELRNFEERSRECSSRHKTPPRWCAAPGATFLNKRAVVVGHLLRFAVCILKSAGKKSKKSGGDILLRSGSATTKALRKSATTKALRKFLELT